MAELSERLVAPRETSCKTLENCLRPAFEKAEAANFLSLTWFSGIDWGFTIIILAIAPAALSLTASSGSDSPNNGYSPRRISL